MNRFIIGIGVACLLVIAIWLTPSMLDKHEVKYDGAPLEIGVVGDIPEIKNEKIHLETLSFEALSDNSKKVSENFNAIMITPKAFEEASNDKFINVYEGLDIPIVFFDSAKTHKPFVHQGLTYDSAYEYLKNGSHTTVYRYDAKINKEDAWYFYLENQKEVDALYTEIFKKIEQL